MDDLSSSVCSRGILCSKEHEVGVGLHKFLSLSYEQLTVVIKHLLPMMQRYMKLMSSLLISHHQGNKKVLTLLSASRTSVGARFNSSKIIQCPFFMAVTSTPICIKNRNNNNLKIKKKLIKRKEKKKNYK